MKSPATSNNGGLAMIDDSLIGQGGLKYAPVDLSGIYLKFGLDLYLL